MPLRLSGLNSGMDTESMINKIMDAEKLKLDKVGAKRTKLTWKQEKWKELNKKLYSLYTGKLSSLRFSSAYSSKTAKSSNENVAKVSASPSASVGNHTLQVKELASTQSMIGAKVDPSKNIDKNSVLSDIGFGLGSYITIESGGKKMELMVNGDTTVNDLINAAKKAGINASFDKAQGRFYLSSKESGTANTFSIKEELDGAPSTAGLTALGLAGPGVTNTAAKDAVYSLDGVEYTSGSNTNTVDGLTFTLQGKTEGYGTPNAKSVSIGVSANVDEAYNNIKAMLKEYNEIIKEMNDLFYAKAAKGYEPLSEKQKKGMSEKEIEKWENKAKEAILRRDDKLSSVLNIMKNAMAGRVEVNGKKYSLASFGITSKNYKEKGVLHIDGDSEDTVSAASEDKLKKALTEHPEETMEALQEIMSGLYSKMTDAMKGTSLSSALTFYNDKEYTKLEGEYKKQYDTLEKKINKIEDKYYKQFAAMEKAMSKLNSQTNYLANLFGNGR